MQLRLLIVHILLVLLTAACQGQPPTQIVLVVTATPDDATAEVQQVEASTTPATATATAATSTPSPTSTVNPLPTPVISEIQVAEQVFENGRLFWLQPVDQIWVMVVTREGGGEWSVYQDTFEEGEIEFDPQLTPPAGVQQPTRGFGKLWRDNPEVREALGWAITPEFGYVTRYEYHRIAPDRQDGYHLLTSLYEETFRFNEADSTWQLN